MSNCVYSAQWQLFSMGVAVLLRQQLCQTAAPFPNRIQPSCLPHQTGLWKKRSCQIPLPPRYLSACLFMLFVCVRVCDLNGKIMGIDGYHVQYVYRITVPLLCMSEFVYKCFYGMWNCAEEYPIINITLCDYRYCSHAVEDGRWSRLVPEQLKL